MARASLKGSAISPGIAIGCLLLLPDSQLCEKRPIEEAEIDAQIAALQNAGEAARISLEEIAQSLPKEMAEYKEIISAQAELARDPRILESAKGRIRHKKICASWALADTIEELCALFHDLADPYLAARSEDIRAIGKCIMEALAGSISSCPAASSCVLAAYELSPTDLMDSLPGSVLGLLTVEGGPTSHIAILARGLKIPAVSGIVELIEQARSGETVIVDGLRGRTILDPNEADLAYYTALQSKYAAFEQEAQMAARGPAITRDGIRASTLANLDQAQEIEQMPKSGAEGIGLYRTEFSYMGSQLPDEDNLCQEYKNVLLGAGELPVIFRTLDIGADKILPHTEFAKEPNPALGIRGIRLCLKNPSLFKTQLRALLRAGAGYPLSIMLPMITSLSELSQTREIMAQVMKELKQEGIKFAQNPALGIMIETPASVLICNQLARECDFISLGTNDLLHYLLAIDRNNRRVAYLHDPLHPAFLRCIKEVGDAGRAHGKPVCVCGELASDPLGLALLLGLGITAFSASPRFIPIIKHLIRKLDYRQCAKIAARALNGEDRDQTRRMLINVLEECMDSVLLFPTSPISTSQ